MMKKLVVLIAGIAVGAIGAKAEKGRTSVDVKLNRKHVVGGVSQFERHKHITAHSHISEPDWVSEDELLDVLLTDLDVAFGRDNGTMIEYLKEATEDPTRPGYIDPKYLEVAGRIHRKVLYGSQNARRHKYDAKNDIMIGGQPHAFIPLPGKEKTPWKLGGADAIGEYMGRFLQEFYRNKGESPKNGQSRPKYVEILNEPMYYFIDGHRDSTVKPKEIFDFHNGAAKAIRRFDKDVMIGGMTMAFPIFEERNFARWDERMKLFIDMSGEHMDFYSMHFYDFNNRGNRGRDDYKGSRIEATFDMVEQYSKIRLGEVKPFVISEYGGRDHKLENSAWTALRDWHFLKAATPLFMSFLDRPNLVLKSIPFITAKAEWGRRKGVPYNRRLMHQVKERPGQIGEDWMFTDLVMYYQFWADVNGTRVEATTNNVDVLTKSYVDGNKVYLVLSNLNQFKEKVKLNLFDEAMGGIHSVKTKHLHRVGDSAVLETKKYKGALKSFTLDPEASAIIEFTFNKDVVIDQSVEENKYYATEYNKAISADTANVFDINSVSTSAKGDAILRVSFGRDKDRSRQPVVMFNGVKLAVPTNYSGSVQPTRRAFFGMLEIPVANNLVKADNKISVTFPDSGGRVSSVTMKHFKINSSVN